MSKRGIADLADVMEGAADRMVELRERAEKAEDALGEAEKRADEAEVALQKLAVDLGVGFMGAELKASRQRIRAAEDQLETLRSGLKAEVERLQGDGFGPDAYYPLEQLLDLSEDTGCSHCKGTGNDNTDDASLIPCRQCRTAEYEAEWKRLRERSEDTEKQSGGGES